MTIKVKGKGGHGSFPERVNDVISAAVAVHTNLHTIKSRSIKSSENFVFTICTFNAGSACNVFPDEATMTGTIRIFNKEVTKEITEKLELITNNTAAAFGCTAEIDYQGSDSTILPTINTPKESENVLRVGAKCVGQDKSNEVGLPLPGSEDFAFYVDKIPGAFLGLGTMPSDQKIPIFPHTSDFNFNDDMIATGAYFWVKLAEDRFAAKII